jgi:hypothetical protein
MQANTYTFAEDMTGCEHRLLVNRGRIECCVTGDCPVCQNEVAAELNDDGERTGQTWLVKRSQPVLAS